MKKRMNKILALGLTVAMMFSIAGCSKKDDTPSNSNNNATPTTQATKAPENTPEASKPSGSGRAEYTADGKRIIKVGTWYEHYYTSDHETIEENPDVTDVELAQMQLDNMRAIEAKYNVEFRFVNLTWNGIIESINTSIMSGKPDVDIYETDLQFGAPAALSGYAMDISKFAAADSDIFTDQTVLSYLSFSGIDNNYLFKPVAKTSQLGGNPLSFNLDMIKQAGLENPQDLYDRGEWTWDKFREYLIATTKDTNGDGTTDVYGYSGWWTVLIENLCMSNGTSIASSATETLSSPATIEAMDFIYKIYNEDHTAAPWNQDDWNVNNQLYAQQKSCFFTGAAWIFKEFGMSPDVGFEIACVPWPTGPSGSYENNKMMKTSGNYYFIPNGVEDPELVYNVFYDWTNWYQGDTELRDDVEWFQNMMMTERNYQYLELMGKREQFDMWGNLGLGDNFSMVPIMSGEKTAAQYAEETKNLVQEALDQYFK